MTNDETTGALKATTGLNIILGIWLFLSPWIYGGAYSFGAWNSWIVGAMVVLFAAIRFGKPYVHVMSVFNTILGAWIFFSPWIFSYTLSMDRFVNSVCVGGLIFLFGIFGMTRHPHHPVQHEPTPHPPV